MASSNHLLSEIWEKYGDVLRPEVYSSDATILSQALSLANLVSVGDFYYYLLDLATGHLINPSEKITTLHSWEHTPTNVHDIMNLIHPDDTEFVIEAEKWILSKFRSLTPAQLPAYKAAYCFRMLDHKNEYSLFHHQAFQLVEPASRKIEKAINIHTHIQNITAVNNYNVTICNMTDNKEVYTYHYSKTPETEKDFKKLTLREREVLRLLICGKTDKEIASQLYISFFTARTHHKNILKKIAAKNTTELTRLCIENGYL